MKTYRQAPMYFLMLLIRDIILCFFVIGFIFLIADICSYLRNSLSITPKSILLKRGILVVSSIEIPYSKINTISVKRGIFGALLGYGNLMVLAGNDISGEVFRGIESPDTIRKEILSKTK